MSTRPVAFAVLALGVLVASGASILIRYAQAEGIGSIAIAAWRLAFASLFLVPLVAARCAGEARRLARRDLLVALAAGLALAAHFAAWISSLGYTSVASSAALVSTNPIWVGLASVVFLGMRLPPATVGGIVLCVAGCLAIVVADGSAAGGNRNPLLGNALALAGALCVSTYLLIGRGLASRVSLLLYVGLVYGLAAVALLAGAWLAGQPLGGWPASGWLLLLALAVGPQLLGHTAFNWALRHLSPTFVALSILGEPVGSAILAALLFGEVPGPWQLAALLVLLAGIVLAALGERKRL
ncbi:MAG: DMT family transporter [Lautropia sp.]